jgi:hypothetical protein
MSQESSAEHLDIAPRTVKYWKQRPGAAPQQHQQKRLNAALERASDRDKARFARLLADARSTPSGTPPSQLAAVPSDFSQDGARVLADPGNAVILRADLAGQVKVAQAGWLAGTAPGVITGYLFSSLAWHRGEPLAAAPSTAAERIRATVQHLMDMDLQFGGGYVRRMFLFFFQSEVVPLLRERHPDPVRREIFRAAAEVAELPALLSAEPVFA